MSDQATASVARSGEADSSFSYWAATSRPRPKTSQKPFDWLATTKGKDMATSPRKKAPKVKASAYDVAEHLRTPEEMAAYLDAWREETPDDVSGIARALSADGNPSFATVLKVAKALGVRLHAQAA